MATETADERRAHIRGVTVTTLASVAGIAAAVGSQVVTAGADPNAAASNTTALYILVAAILAQLPVLQVLGIDVEDFSAKDYLYIGFMTFSLWFVAWGVMLTTRTTLPF
jgi:predicted aconitase with swiveling domain